MSDRLIIEIGTDRVVLDEAQLGTFEDLTPAELRALGKLAEHRQLLIEGEPSVFLIAACVTLKAARGRSWDRQHIEAVIELVGSWLSGTLIEIEGDA